MTDIISEIPIESQLHQKGPTSQGVIGNGTGPVDDRVQVQMPIGEDLLEGRPVDTSSLFLLFTTTVLLLDSEIEVSLLVFVEPFRSCG